MSKSLAQIKNLLGAAFAEFKKDNASGLAASLTYYLLFSLAPLFYVVISIGGIIYERSEIEGELFYYLQRAIGTNGAEFFQHILLQADTLHNGFWAATIGVLMLLFGAINFYVALERAFYEIYESAPKPQERKVKAYIKKRMLSLAFLFGTTILLVIMIFINLIVGGVRSLFSESSYVELSNYGLQVFNFLFAFLVIFLLFALIYKILSDFRITWKVAFAGAGISAFLFIAANVFLSLYFKYSNTNSLYGVGGTIILTLIWIYYSSQIFLFGVEVIKVLEKNLCWNR